MLGPDDGSWDVGGIGHFTLTPYPALLRDITAIMLQVCQKKKKKRECERSNEGKETAWMMAGGRTRIN